MDTIPRLSVCIPAYQRPDWLKRALNSILNHPDNILKTIEIMITDDSRSQACREVTQTMLKHYPGPWHYQHNPERLGMVHNWNQSLALATGEYVVVLHDDDYFLKNGLSKIINLLRLDNSNPPYPLILFGVHLVTATERLIRIQAPPRQQYLTPQQALLNLLNNSSFVRFPGLVIQRQLLQDYGYFSPEFGEATDIEMWLRLMAQVGVYCVSDCTVAYTIHTQALTMGMFTPKTLTTLRNIFQLARATKLLTPPQFNQAEANFLHQFILAGTIRFLKQRQWPQAHAVFQLFHAPIMQGVGFSWKWWGLRRGLGVLLTISARLIT